MWRIRDGFTHSIISLDIKSGCEYKPSIKKQTNNRVQSFPLIAYLPIIFVALIEVTLFAEPRTFKSAAGKEIVAVLVSHDGNGTIQLKRNDGILFGVKVGDLSQEDQHFLKEWVKANPPKVDYRFEFDVAAEKTSGVNSRLTGDQADRMMAIEVRGSSFPPNPLYPRPCSEAGAERLKKRINQ